MTIRAAAGDAINHAALQADRLRHFHALTNADQVIAIRKLAIQGLSDRDIGTATGWPLDAIRNVLGPRPPR